jgi:hypothetical protein
MPAPNIKGSTIAKQIIEKQHSTPITTPASIQSLLFDFIDVGEKTLVEFNEFPCEDSDIGCCNLSIIC